MTKKASVSRTLKSPRTLKIAVALLVSSLALSACGSPDARTAATVGDQTISIQTLQASVNEIIEGRRSAGEPDVSDLDSGDLTRDQLRFHVLSELIAIAARAEGVVVSNAEVDARRRAIVEQLGGEQNLEAALVQAGIASRDFRLYIYDLLYQEKLGDALVPGEGAEVEAKRSDAVTAALLKAASDTKVVINPRYGSFEPTTGEILQNGPTPGPAVPQDQP
jgi:hypothetical protein